MDAGSAAACWRGAGGAGDPIGSHRVRPGLELPPQPAGDRWRAARRHRWRRSALHTPHFVTCGARVEYVEYVEYGGVWRPGRPYSPLRDVWRMWGIWGVWRSMEVNQITIAASEGRETATQPGPARGTVRRWSKSGRLASLLPIRVPCRRAGSGRVSAREVVHGPGGVRGRLIVFGRQAPAEPDRSQAS
jgi:hypothetical protein